MADMFPKSLPTTFQYLQQALIRKSRKQYDKTKEW
ncbi:hypothetical protein FNYG_14470 [Fusarium nygamai]|uniref:Uncharacterized protein n=1 Tax=Gibberella nygamai TaxID=42673 RepID=A0A2K0USV5_GIBNY|nr:hypothetical protein FNYG_14470 [Fusarium nygamai]